MPASHEPGPGRGLLVWTAASAAVVVVGSLGLVHGLTRMLPTGGGVAPVRLAGDLREPEVTGSIATDLGGQARSVSLDPCIGRERLVVRGPSPVTWPVRRDGRADNAD